MSSWYYYDNNGTKVGPITASLLKELARQGVVTRETKIENVNGRSEIAGNVRGIPFPEITLPEQRTGTIPQNTLVAASPVTSEIYDIVPLSQTSPPPVTEPCPFTSDLPDSDNPFDSTLPESENPFDSMSILPPQYWLSFESNLQHKNKENTMSKNSVPPNKADFESALNKRLSDARDKGKVAVTISSLELHHDVGGYPNPHNRMPICCDVMRAFMNEDSGDRILREPNKGDGATLEIIYFLGKGISPCQ